MGNEYLEKYANVACSMTGSNISTTQLFKTVYNLDKATKKSIYSRIASVMKENSTPLLPVAKNEFIEMSKEFIIDPAVLVQVYIQEMESIINKQAKY